MLPIGLLHCRCLVKVPSLTSPPRIASAEVPIHQLLAKVEDDVIVVVRFVVHLVDGSQSLQAEWGLSRCSCKLLANIYFPQILGSIPK